MKSLGNKKSVIGEGPIWNINEQKLYITNGFEKEILIYKNTVEIRKTPVTCAAVCFSADNKLIVSYEGGVGILEKNATITPIYDITKYEIKYANDMKVGPDGRIYVGTQSSKFQGVSDEVNGKLYSIDKFGKVSVLLDGLILSNGLDWSPDEKVFYHTDSGVGIIKEYNFDKIYGKISFTGREIKLPGIDGFCVAENGDIYAAIWSEGAITVIDALKLQIKNKIFIPANISASCNFVGKNFEHLAITSATFDCDKNDKNAGLIFLCDVGIKGKSPYYFETLYKGR